MKSPVTTLPSGGTGDVQCESRQGARGDLDLGERYRLIRAMRQPGIASAVMQGWNTAESGQQTQVTAVGRAPHLRLASIPSTGHRMRVPHAFQQVATWPQT